MNASNSHPTRDELVGYARGTLDETSAERLEMHLGECPTCESMLGELETQADSLGQALRQTPPLDPYVVESACARAVKGAAEAGKNSAAADLKKESTTSEPAEVPHPAEKPRRTGEQILASLANLGLLPPAEVDSLRTAIKAGRIAADAESLCRELVRSGQLTKFQAQILYQGRERGLMFGEYVVLDRIGAGGMGQVFKARHRRMDRIVAVKVMSVAAMKSADSVKRFEREVKAAAKLNHPNIVTAYDAGQQDNVHFLVMEFVDGSDLAGIVKKNGPLPVDKVVAYIRQAATGLAFAHGKGVVHRDIKPANLLVDAEGTVKILDMGLARLDGDAASLGANEGLTQTGQVMGTVDYMAPEQAFDTRHADARADMYSLGCTLYRLLTGNNLFAGDTLVQKILAHREQPIPSLVTVRPEVPRQLDAIYQRMVAKKPEDRPTMAELVKELEHLNREPGASATGARETGDRGQEAGDRSQGTAASAVVIDTHKAAASTKPAPRNKAATGGRGSRKRPPTKILLAAAGAAALLFLGVWVIFRDKDGNETGRFRLPDGGSVTVQDDTVKKTVTMAPASSASPPSADGAESHPPTKSASPGKVPNLLADVAKMQTAAKSPSPGKSSISAASAPPSGDYALSFHDGASVEVASLPAALDRNGPMTIEVWVHPIVKDFKGQVPVVGTSDTMFGLCINNSCNFAYQVAWDPPITFDGNENWKYTQIGGQGAHENRRYHVACVRTDREYFCFVDGVLKSSKSGSPGSIRVPVEPITIGGADTHHGYFHGIVDEVRISKVARYIKSFTPQQRLENDTGTIALYHFDEGAGDVLHDASGNGHHGKIVGAKWVRADGGPIPVLGAVASSSPSPGNYALSAPGVSTGAKVDFSKPFTFEVYITPDSDRKSQDAQHSLLVWNVIGLGGDKEWSWFLRQGTAPPIAASGIAPQRGVRTHVAGVYTPTELRLYVNGKKAAVAPLAGASVPSTPGSVGIGYEFTDVFDEVRVSQVARYDADFTPQERFTPDADTLLLYHCDEGTGDVLHDASGNGHHGKIVGAKWVRADGSPIDLKSEIPDSRSTTPPLAIAPFDAQQAKAHQEAWAKHLGTTVETTNSVGMKMVLIPPGEFLMGRSPRDVENLSREKLTDDDLPAHKVTLARPFAIAATEVTQGQWKAIVGTSPWSGKRMAIDDDRRPATYVNWKDATEFCRQLSLKESVSYRLPTEAEWEYACRSGTQTSYSFGDVAGDLPQYAWTRSISQDLPQPVAMKKPNPWGLFDVHGNAWEWTDDVHGQYSADAAVDPHSRGSGSVKGLRTLRGGCFWSVFSGDYRSSARRPWSEGLGYAESGFRVVREIASDSKSDILKPQTQISDSNALTPYELLTSPEFVWSAPENLGPVVNSPANDTGACLSADGLTLVFASDRAGGDSGLDLYVSSRASLDAPWEMPQRMDSATINSPRDDAGPSLSADGLTLVFYRDDRPPRGGADLFMATRRDKNASWSAAVSLGPVVNSTNYDYSPCISADGLSLYFHSGRDGGGVANSDLFISRRKSVAESFGPPQNLGSTVNSPGIEYDPCISSDSRVLVFFSNRIKGTPNTIWITARADWKRPWPAPSQLDIPALANVGDFGPALSHDGRTLLFHGARPGGQGGDDLWMVRRVKRN